MSKNLNIDETCGTADEYDKEPSFWPVKILLASSAIALAVMLVSGCSVLPCEKFAAVGAGYKVNETEITGGGVTRSPISARIEIGGQCERIKYGIGHHSQWFVGKPFKGNDEYSKTEIFIDYVWREK